MIRVLRLMEYEYPDAATMEDDMRHWSVPPVGSKNFMHLLSDKSKHRNIRSTILTDFNVPEPEVSDERQG